jgi:non-heme chloroperoxidase
MDSFARPGAMNDEGENIPPHPPDSATATRTASGLELLHAPAVGDPHPVPLLFVHGAYVGAWCWAEHFLPHFAAAGFDAYAVSLRGHGFSPGREGLAGHSIDDYAADVAEAIAAIGRPPVVIGHSMGGFVLQRYLSRQALPGVVMIAAVPPQGLGAASFELAWRDPSLLTELNGLIQAGRASPAALLRAMFAQPVDAERLARYHRLCQRESPRAIWDMTFVHPFRHWGAQRVPLLYLAAELDRLIPLHHHRSGAALLGATVETLPGFGHGVMLESGWMQAADCVIGWLRAQTFA